MTLLLIAVIVFLLVWGCQVGDRKAKQKEYHDRTRTNLVLEKEIYLKVEDEITARLNATDIPVGEIYSHLLILYDEYQVPYRPFHCQWGIYHTREDLISDKARQCKEDELHAKKYGFKLDPEIPLENPEHPTVMDRIRYSYINKEAYQFYGHREYTRSSNLEAFYRELISRITQKRMYELGYAFTQNGVRDSDWQEQAKQLEEMERLKAKYPYLFR